MFRVIYDQDDRLIPWAEQRIGEKFRSDARAIGQERDGQIVAAVVYDNFSNVDCNMHIASDGSGKWLTRELLVRAFAFPFIQCGFRRVTGLVPADNAEALKFDLHLGFEIEGRCREAMPDGSDVIVLGMLRRNCRYIPTEARNA